MHSATEMICKEIFVDDLEAHLFNSRWKFLNFHEIFCQNDENASTHVVFSIVK